MIRLIIVVLLLLIFAVFSLIALPILWLIGKKNPVAKEKASDAVARFMFRLILFVCGTKTTAIGVENIPTDKPVLFVGNHRGFFDVIISYTYIKTRAAYVAKRRWQKYLYFVYGCVISAVFYSTDRTQGKPSNQYFLELNILKTAPL